jgi:hypothetical protein
MHCTVHVAVRFRLTAPIVTNEGRALVCGCASDKFVTQRRYHPTIAGFVTHTALNSTNARRFAPAGFCEWRYRLVSITDTNGVAPPVANLGTSADIAFHSGVAATALKVSRLSNQSSVRM